MQDAFDADIPPFTVAVPTRNSSRFPPVPTTKWQSGWRRGWSDLRRRSISAVRLRPDHALFITSKLLYGYGDRHPRGVDRLGITEAWARQMQLADTEQSHTSAQNHSQIRAGNPGYSLGWRFSILTPQFGYCCSLVGNHRFLSDASCPSHSLSTPNSMSPHVGAQPYLPPVSCFLSSPGAS